MHQLGLEQQRQRRSETTAAPCPFLSVIVPVLNEAAFIADTLHHCWSSATTPIALK